MSCNSFISWNWVRVRVINWSSYIRLFVFLQLRFHKCSFYWGGFAFWKLQFLTFYFKRSRKMSLSWSEPLIIQSVLIYIGGNHPLTVRYYNHSWESEAGCRLQQKMREWLNDCLLSRSQLVLLQNPDSTLDINCWHKSGHH